MALDGINVLDLSRLAPGPYCSMMLADFGASVLLVEPSPGTSPKLSDAEADTTHHSWHQDALRRGKRSIMLNLKEKAAQEVFYRLAETADVILEGFRPGVVERLGVAYPVISQLNPRIIYCSLSGFGQYGPYSHLVGHDINYISVAGVLDITGRSGTGPAIPGNVVGDFAAGGLQAAFAICLALLARGTTGRGQYIDVAMSDGALSLMTSYFSSYFAGDMMIHRGAHQTNGGAPWYNTYKCKDGAWFAIGSVEPHFYDALCDVLDLPQYKDRQHEADLFAEMTESYVAMFVTRTAAEWMEIMSQRDIGGTPVLDMAQVVSDPHNLARNMIIDVGSGDRAQRQIGIAPKLSETPGEVRGVGPHPGEHTGAVLASLGHSEEAIRALVNARIVA